MSAWAAAAASAQRATNIRMAPAVAAIYGLPYDATQRVNPAGYSDYFMEIASLALETLGLSPERLSYGSKSTRVAGISVLMLRRAAMAPTSNRRILINS